MGGTVNARGVTIRGHGSGRLHHHDAREVTVDCPYRLLPGRPYVVQGVGAEGDSCRMRVVAASVHTLRGEGGVVYRVTLQPESSPRIVGS
jgi:hypothetical protein